MRTARNASTRAALLLAAVAVLGIQRVPCLLAAQAPPAVRAAASAPPCHGATPEPLGDTGEREPRCAQCSSLHRVLGQAPAPSGLGAGASALALAAAPVAVPAPPPLPRAPGRFGAGRAPDPFSARTVLLL
jgi:hypothetical protein